MTKYTIPFGVYRTMIEVNDFVIVDDSSDLRFYQRTGKVIGMVGDICSVMFQDGVVSEFHINNLSFNN